MAAQAPLPFTSAHETEVVKGITVALKVKNLTPRQMQVALEFLAGYDPAVTQDALDYAVKKHPA